MGRLRYPKATNLKDDRNMDVYHQVKHELWTDARKVTRLQKVLGCMDNQIFLPKVPLGDESFATTSMLSV